MSTREKLIKARLGMLALAEELQNISWACRRAGISRSHFYEITNGFCERFHRTVKEEFYAVAFRRTFYESLEQLQRDLDAYVAFYNRERAHQGYRTQGRTPFQTWSAGVAQLRREEVKPEAA